MEEEIDNKTIHGNLCDEVLEENDIEEIEVGSIVFVYTKSVSQRPWTGEVKEIKKDSDEFVIQWYLKHGKRRQFTASINHDGSPNLGVCSLQSVMFSDICEERTSDSFKLSNYWLTIIDAGVYTMSCQA